MATTYDQVYQKFIEKINDVRLINLPEAEFNYVMTNYLDSACARFTKCNQDLSLRDDNSQSFLITLTPFEIEILATIMVFVWIQPQINRITLLRQSLTDGDFKIHSQANHLRELENLRNYHQSEFNRLLVQYTFDFGTNNMWDALGPNGNGLV